MSAKKPKKKEQPRQTVLTTEEFDKVAEKVTGQKAVIKWMSDPFWASRFNLG